MTTTLLTHEPADRDVARVARELAVLRDLRAQDTPADPRPVARSTTIRVGRLRLSVQVV